MTGVFELPKELPAHPRKAALYRTVNGSADALHGRLDGYTSAFGLKAKPRDAGDRFVFEEKDYTFEVYKASDSLWWTHKRLAYRETMPARAKLPTEEEALGLSADLLKGFNLDTSRSEVSDISYTESVITDKKKEKSTSYRTAIQINSTFRLDGIPVFGPGAKIEVALVEGHRLAELLYFWREVEKQDALPLISPEEALKKFTGDPAMAELSPDHISVKLEAVRFGYFAAPPAEVQSYLLPVYAVDGTARAKDAPGGDFTRYVVAMDLSPDEIKRLGYVGEVESHEIF